MLLMLVLSKSWCIPTIGLGGVFIFKKKNLFWDLRLALFPFLWTFFNDFWKNHPQMVCYNQRIATRDPNTENYVHANQYVQSQLYNSAEIVDFSRLTRKKIIILCICVYHVCNMLNADGPIVYRVFVFGISFYANALIINQWYFRIFP